MSRRATHGCLRGPTDATLRPGRDPNATGTRPISGPASCPSTERRLLRKLAIALLAVPVLAVVYTSTALGRSMVARSALAVGLGALIGLGVIAIVHPSPATATPVSTDLPLTAANFRTVVATDRALDEPVTIEFSAPMDQRSVAAALKVQPPVGVDLSWDATGRVLTVAPSHRWVAGTYHTITVDAGALALSGAPMASPARAAFLTRDEGGVRISPSDRSGTRVGVGSAFLITFDRPVDSASVAPSVHLAPAAKGTVTATPAGDGLTAYTFTPSKALRPNVRYRLVVDGVRDVDGVRIARGESTFRTIASAGVVRFRPRDSASDIARDAAISVRFTAPMDPASTTSAFKVTAAGKPVAGKATLVENGTVLVFIPSKALPYGAKVTMVVGTSARTADGSALARSASGWFKTVAKPKARAAVKHRPSGGGGGSTGPGRAVGGGSWGSVETYYLGLMNCTRTGGWVTSGGGCSSPGGRNVAPLKLDRGISSKVSRPYARKLAVGADCSHFIGGTPGDRLRRAGYTSYRWAENLGCRSGNARGAVLGSHRFFQSEKSYNGGHYVNLMNAKYDRVGIGVWVSHGRVRLVIDFYHP